MKLQKSDALLAICLLSFGGVTFSSMSDVGLTPPPSAISLEMEKALFKWVEKNGVRIARELRSDITFRNIKEYADENDLDLPDNLKFEEKVFIVGAVQAAAAPEEPVQEPVVVVGDKRLTDSQVLRAARKELESSEVREIAAYVRKHKLSIHTFTELLDAFKKSDNEWDQEDLNTAKMSGHQKGNWVRIYQKVFELYDEEHAQNSQHLFKVVEVVQDLAQQEARGTEEKGRAVKNQLSNVLEVVEMLTAEEKRAYRESILSETRAEKEEQRANRELERIGREEMQQQLNRTLEVVKFANDAKIAQKRAERAERKAGKKGPFSVENAQGVGIMINKPESERRKAEYNRKKEELTKKQAEERKENKKKRKENKNRRGNASLEEGESANESEALAQIEDDAGGL